MLYDEFLNGTKAKQSKETFEQYQLLEKIYMDCESVSKEDIYKLWKKTYGKELARRETLKKERIEKLCVSYDEMWDALHNGNGYIRSETHKIFNKIMIETCQTKRFDGRYETVFIDEFGVEWTKNQVGTYPNGTIIYRLFAIVDKKLVPAPCGSGCW